MCGDRLWAFERVVGAFLEAFDDREERNVQTKTECEKLCLFETSFTCRYNTILSHFFFLNTHYELTIYWYHTLHTVYFFVTIKLLDFK